MCGLGYSLATSTPNVESPVGFFGVWWYFFIVALNFL